MLLLEPLLEFEDELFEPAAPAEPEVESELLPLLPALLLRAPREELSFDESFC